MARPLRTLSAPNTVVEITATTIQNRYLLRPSDEVNDIILGCIARAQEQYPTVALHLFVFLSTHFDLILSAPDHDAISRFVGHLKSNIARELGPIHDWEAKFWGRRFRSIPVLDEEALLGRVRYVLSHGCKENLVDRPGDWPGVQCVRAVTRGERLFGTWLDRTGRYRASRKKGEAPRAADFAQRLEVKLTPLPCWAELSEAQRQAKYRRLVKEIEAETRARHAAAGTRPLGVSAVLSQDPHARPARPKRSPAPLCHAASRAVREEFRKAYRAFVSAYRAASARFRAGALDVEFPSDCFRPPLPYQVAAGAFAPAAPG